MPRTHSPQYMYVTQTMLKKEFASFREIITHEIVQAMHDQFRLFADLMRQETRAMIKQEVRPIVREEITAAKKEILYEVAEMLDISVLPQLDNHETRIARLEASSLRT